MAASHDNNTIQEIDKNWFTRVTAGFAICSLALALFLMTKHPRLYLTMEMSSSTPSTAQLYYNTGAGYNEAESQTVPVLSHSLQSFQKLRFALPAKEILSLRFDPLVTTGRYTIRNITIRNRLQTLLRIAPADAVPFNQIQSRVQQDDKVTFSTTPDAKDSGITLKLQRPFNGKRIMGQEKSALFLIGSAILLGIAILTYLKRGWLENAGHRARLGVRQVDAVFGKVARKISTPEFMQFDSYAIWFYALCIAGFVIAGAADLNGSSIGMYNSAGEGAPKSVLIGESRAVRSDEWVYYTPDIMNQCLRAHRFEVEHTQRGGHDVSLMDNVPVMHVSTLFRPQFWPFFILPIDYAFAFYWQFKALLLLLGVFSLLLLITRSSFWSITGSLWLFFSPLTQWSYSWSSELPEMMGLACFATVFFCFLTVAKNGLALMAIAWAFATCTIDFALCAYVPHLLPLAWLTVFFIISWGIASHRTIFRRQFAWRRILAIGAAFIAIGVIGAIVYLDLRQAIIGIENTDYPGKRVYAGGSLPLQYLTSSFMQWTDTERHFPPALSNISEGSGCLWLAPITLFLMGRLTLGRFQKIAFGAVWGFSVLILAWLLLPVPMDIGRIFGMNRTGATRCTPALALANVLIVSLAMAVYNGNTEGKDLRRLRSLPVLVRTFGIFLVMTTILALTNDLIGAYYSAYTVGLSALGIAILIVLMLERRKVLFALALIGPQAIVFGAVNPVQHGLGVVLNSSLYRFVHSHPALLNGEWMVFSDSVVPSGFLAATGSEVYTGMHFLPDVDNIPLLASHGLDVKIFNNGTYLVAHALGKGEKSSFQRIQTDVVKWNLSPLDPLLPRLGIKYVAFDHRPSPAIASHLIPLIDWPLDGLWLYRLP